VTNYVSRDGNYQTLKSRLKVNYNNETLTQKVGVYFYLFLLMIFIINKQNKNYGIRK